MARYSFIEQRIRRVSAYTRVTPAHCLHPMFRSLLSTILFLTLLIAVGIAGCDTLQNDSRVTGRVEVLLTDAPMDDFDEVLVTIDRVELLGVDSSGESTLFILSDERREFDLLQLRNGVTAQLADADIPAGSYHQLRLVVDRDADVLLKDGSRLKLPSGSESGLKVIFPLFEVRSDSDVIQVTVDFDVNDSFVQAGSSGMYVFKPVLRAESLVINGEAVAVDEGDDAV